MVIKKDSIRLDKKPKCKPGNKPCGKTCIPMKQKCKVNRPRVNGKLTTGQLAKAGLVVGGGIVAPIASMGLMAKGLIDNDKKRKEESKQWKNAVESLNQTGEKLKERGLQNSEINKENLSQVTKQVGQAIDNKRKSIDEENNRENSKKLAELRAKREQEAKDTKTKKQKDLQKEKQRKSDEIYFHKYKKAQQKQLKDDYLADETGRDRHEEYDKKKSSKKLDSVIARIRYIKLDSKLKCTTGNKKCGKICIPQKSTCKINNPKIKSSTNLSSKAKKLLLPSAMGLAGVGLLGVGVNLSKKIEAKNKENKERRNRGQEFAKDVKSKMAKWGEEPISPMKTNYEKGEELANTEYETKIMEVFTQLDKDRKEGKLSSEAYAKKLAEQLKLAASSSKTKNEPLVKVKVEREERR